METAQRIRRGDGLRAKLVEAAIECFSRHGYQGTSIDRIARATGVTKGALYYHFRDKEDLLLGAIDDRIARFENRIVERARELRDPEAVLRAIVEICIEQAATSNERRFILTLMVETLDTHPDLSLRFREMMRRFREFVAHTIHLGREKGQFRRDVDPEVSAKIFVATVLGTELQFYQDEDDVPIRESMRAAAEAVLEWLGPTPS